MKDAKSLFSRLLFLLSGALNFLSKHKLLIVVIVSSLVYVNALNNQFVSDDYPGIVDNKLVGDLNHSLSMILDYSNGLSPLSFSILYLIGGLNPFIYHFANIVFHVLTTVVVFLLLKALFDERLAFFSSLLFGLHPLHTEAVTWIAGQVYPQYSLVVLLSFLFFVKYIKKENAWLLYAASFVIYTISLLVSVKSVFLPAILILYLIIEKKLASRRTLLYPFVLVSLFYLLLSVGYIQYRTVEVSGNPGSLSSLLIIPVQLLIYFYYLLDPRHMVFFHDGVSEYMRYQNLSYVFVALLSAVIILSYYRSKRVILFSLGFFFASISIMLSPLRVNSFISDRYAYLPSLGFCVLLAYLVIVLIEKFFPAKWAKAAMVLAFGSIVTFYSYQTVKRNEDWSTNQRFWSATLRDAPESGRAHASMAIVYTNEKNYQEALKESEQAVALSPKLPDVYGTRGDIYYFLGDYTRSLADYEKAISLDPSNVRYRSNFAVVLFITRNYALSEQALKEALAIAPSDYKSHKVLGELYLRMGKKNLSEQHLIWCQKVDPSDESITKMLEEVKIL